MPLLIRGARQLITLQGASGPRRGSGLRDLRIIADGAILTREGRIEQVGQTRRLERLAAARNADVVEAAGRVVMPAFVDAITRPLAGPPFVPLETAHNIVRGFSFHRMEQETLRRLSIFARYGTVTLGAGCGYGGDETLEAKALRVFGGLDGRPLRVVPQYHFLAPGLSLSPAWLARIREKRLAAALASPDPDLCARSEEAGLAAIRLASASALASGVHILLPGEAYHGGCPYPPARQWIEQDRPVALSTGYDPRISPIASMPMILSLACTQMKLTAEEAIAAATINAAHALGLAGECGSLETGKAADLVMLHCGDYREAPWFAGYNPVALSIRNGKPVDLRQFARC
ncbi:MAG: amidohydrolase family protein [Bryobacteraceae bacterium]